MKLKSWILGTSSVVILSLMGSPAGGQSQIIRRIETPSPTATDPQVPSATPSPSPSPAVMPKTPLPSSIVPSVDVLTEWHIQQNVCSGHWQPDEITALFPNLSLAEIELICRETASTP